MNKEKETLYTMALTHVPRLNTLNQRLVYEAMGSATALYENRHELKQYLPDAQDTLLENLARMDELLPRVEQELAWDKEKQIQCLCINDADYPARLRECPDAPLVLYYLGQANLNCLHVINMVGTRQCTEYGKDFCRNFAAELAALRPDCLVVSGLAYGIDIHAHRAALQNDLPTVGVLAHGLDRIYPHLHRSTALEMLQKGGLLTEYMSGTSPEKMNFVARNRIVAGIAEATVVVESASKGGSLITASLAEDYNRDVFAVPGRVGDTYSAGCNALIREDKAHLITSAQDMIDILGWPTQEKSETARKKGIQRELFVEMTDEERRVANGLQGCDGKAINQLSIDINMPIGQLSSLLFTMEMKGLVKTMVGGMYRLL